MRMELSADVREPSEVGHGGTLAGWQDAVAAAASAENCPHWQLGTVGGFVGPVVEICGFQTCGFNLSGPSSCGKTLSQQLAVSAWTSPRLTSNGLLKSARFTENSIELLARGSNGTVLGIDELALIDGKVLRQVIYGLASGVGKARMTVDLKLRRPIRWATFILLSCETSLERKIRGDGGEWLGGLPARFADIDCSDVNRKVPQATIAAIGGICSHYGHAGPAFVRRFKAERLHHNPDDLRQRILDKASKLAGIDPPGVRTRAALSFALLSICGTLAQELGVLPQAIDIATAVAWAWDRFVVSSDAGALDPEQQAEANLRRYVAERRDITIKKTEPSPSDPRNNRDAVGWYDDKAVYIPVDRIFDAAGAVLSERAIGRMLQVRGLLVRRGKDRLSVKYVPKIGYVPSYALKLSEFGPTVGGSGEDE
jgi:Domain of unknown function (DUF927)